MFALTGCQHVAIRDEWTDTTGCLLATQPAMPQDEIAEWPETVGRYEVVRELARGGTGAVLLAHDPVLNRRVALKVTKVDASLGRSGRERVLQEARLAAAVNHPNVCPTYDAGITDEHVFLVMQYIPGPCLAEVVAENGPITGRRAAHIIRHVARALGSLHAQGIVHRDVKPANVVLDAEGNPVLVDFGVADRRGEQKPSEDYGAFTGSPAYMSPEQVDGHPAVVGARSDLYSLGVVMYELLTGTRPFQGDLSSVFLEILTESPVSPAVLRPGLDNRLAQICLKLMAKRPDDRYATADEVVTELSVWLAGDRTSDRQKPECQKSEVRRPSLRRRTPRNSNR